MLGTDTLPPYTYTLATAANAVCADHTIAAVVEDSQGQTASASTPLTVDCTTAVSRIRSRADRRRSRRRPAKPSIPGTLPALTNRGGLVRVAPVAPGGIASVDFFLGARKVCTRTAAPYECSVLPTGADVGTQALRVVVTDLVGQTGESSRAVQIGRFKVSSLRLTADKLKRTSKTKGWRIQGRVEPAEPRHARPGLQRTRHARAQARQHHPRRTSSSRSRRTARFPSRFASLDAGPTS